MADSYKYNPHPRINERKSRGPVKTHDMRGTKSPNFISRINAKLGLRVTLAVGSMWMAYLFSLIALIALPSALRQGTYYVVVWLSSSFLQLVLLPIIIVGQNIQAAAADSRAEETYKDAEAVLHEAEEIQKHLLAQDERISEIVEQLRALIGNQKA
jgi:Protein of unknown function (DUF1003)